MPMGRIMQEGRAVRVLLPLGLAAALGMACRSTTQVTHGSDPAAGRAGMGTGDSSGASTSRAGGNSGAADGPHTGSRGGSISDEGTSSGGRDATGGGGGAGTTSSSDGGSNSSGATSGGDGTSRGGDSTHASAGDGGAGGGGHETNRGGSGAIGGGSSVHTSAGDGGTSGGDGPGSGGEDARAGDGGIGGSTDGGAGSSHCPTGCSIEDECYLDGEVNPENDCLICDTQQSTDDWTSDNGKSCDDELFCTDNDVCAQGTCLGEPRSCDDSVACNGGESCDEEEDRCLSAASTCPDGTICDVESDTCTSTCTGCAIDGNCYGDGIGSPNDPCLTCDVAQSESEWSVDAGATCDDGSLCTDDDACNTAGACIGVPVVCEDDGGACGANRSCDGGTGQCVAHYPGNTTSCNDDDACTVDDRCDGSGDCLGVARDCSDEHACTSDSCESGECVHEVMGGSCLIDGACKGAGAANPLNACEICNPGSNQNTWTALANSCLIGNTCYSDGTSNPSLPSCQYCNASGNPNGWSQRDNTCLIGGQCYSTGDENPTNRCQVCDPSAQNGMTEWTTISNTWWDSVERLCWQNPAETMTMSLSAATAHCEDQTWGGKDDWHLPYMDELFSLIRGCTDGEQSGASGTSLCSMTPAGCDQTASGCAGSYQCAACTSLEGPGSGGCYWPAALSGTCGGYFSLTAYSPSSSGAWTVNYTYGINESWGATSSFYVRCVR